MQNLPFFQKRVAFFAQLSQNQQKKIRLVSWGRTGMFLMWALSVILLIRQSEFLWATLVGALLFGGFLALIRWHNRLSYTYQQFRFLEQFNQDEIDRLTGLPGLGNTGESFSDPSHPYSGDLDIFGNRSLFRLLDRTTTAFGKEALSKLLLHPPSLEVLMDRQTAVKELAGNPDFIQTLRARGAHHSVSEDAATRFVTWLVSDRDIAVPKYLRVLALGMPFLSLALAIGLFFWGWSFYYVVVLAVINSYFLRKLIKPIAEVTHQGEGGVKTLQAASGIIYEIENQQVIAPLLQSLQQPFLGTGQKESALQSIRALEAGLHALFSRSNALYGVFNIFFLLDVHLLHRVVTWKYKHGSRVALWFDHIGQWEALCALAGYAHAHPERVYPVLTSEWEWNGSQLGHPLITQEHRVTNDFSIQGQGTVVLITGSNMSGKSTFLRTLGINTVLALAGGPVCALALKLPIVQLFTSMRTLDSLEESVSAFYAELKRIESLLAMVRQSSVPVMFMLDELLKGTNSADRHKGAMGLMRQLGRERAFGLVSTHDLALANFTPDSGATTHYHFDSYMQADELIFDYKLKEGVCESFNATYLMQKIGIEIT